jgi:putative membrane protein
LLFAGLFYIVRLFVYFAEADKPEQEKVQQQFKIMQRKLWYIITWPALIGTWVAYGWP